MSNGYIVTVRAALVAIRVMDSERPWTPTTGEVAQYLRMTDSGARRMMGKLSGPDALPIYQDEEGRWRRAESGESLTRIFREAESTWCSAWCSASCWALLLPWPRRLI